MGSIGMKQENGFSLLELMIVVVVVAILAAIAYPSYRSSVAASHRAEAKAVLLEAAQYMEREFTRTGNYNSANIASAGLNSVPRDGGAAYYQLAVTPSGGAYTLSASPTGSMGGDQCGVMILNQAGQQSVSGASLAASECW